MEETPDPEAALRISGSSDIELCSHLLRIAERLESMLQPLEAKYVREAGLRLQHKPEPKFPETPDSNLSKSLFTISLVMRRLDMWIDSYYVQTASERLGLSG